MTTTTLYARTREEVSEKVDKYVNDHKNTIVVTSINYVETHTTKSKGVIVVSEPLWLGFISYDIIERGSTGHTLYSPKAFSHN